MAKKTTIDDLARMVGKGFQGMEERIGGLEERMGGLEERMGGLEERMRGLEERMATKDDLRALEERMVRSLEGLEIKISSYASSWNRSFSSLHDWIKDVDERLTALESKGKRH